MEKTKVLVIENDTDTRALLKKLLVKNNFKVIEASDGEKAVEKIKKNPPQIIISNWVIPSVNGLDICKLVKSNEELRIIYFIFFTARASLKDRVTALDAGADEFIIKPVENQELLARIRSGERIYKMQDELKNFEHVKAVIEIATTMGHNLNNPLSSLKLSLFNLKNNLKKPSDPEIKEDLDIIDKSVERIQKLIKELSDLKNPQFVNYIADRKMIKLQQKG